MRLARVCGVLLLAGLAVSSPKRDGRPPAEVSRRDNPPAKLRVAAVQMRSSRDLARNVSQINRHLRRLAGEGVRVAVFPECALTGYFEDVVVGTNAETLAQAEQEIAATCRNVGIYAIVGTPYHDGDRLFNSAVVFAPTGKVVERYHKIQLAEAWPSPGDHLSVFKVDGVPCSIIICHDERYPELVRLPVLAGSRVIFYVSHESGVRQEGKIDPYRAQIQARAVENSVFVVHANAPANTDTTGSHGQSRIVAPDGNLVKEASIFDEEVVVSDLDLKLATGENAKKSRTRGPLARWWEDGVKLVRVIEEDDAR